MNKPTPIAELLQILARLRAPNGCPWDREQDHMSLRFHAVEEVYELLDAIEAGDDHEMAEELGDLLLQIVFHSQIARERGAFDFNTVCRHLVGKLIRRHPHVFGEAKVKTAQAVWALWDHIKQGEKAGARPTRPSALDGIPKHLPALLRVEKLVRKARKAKLLPETSPSARRRTKAVLAQELFALAEYAQRQGWSAELLLRAEARRRERALRRKELKALRKRRSRA